MLITKARILSIFAATVALCIGQLAHAATLTLISSMPANNAIDASRTDSLSLTFSTPLDPRSASRNGVLLQSALGLQKVSLSVSGAVLTIRPLTTLLPFTRYTLNVSLLTGSNGEQIEAPVSITFKTRDGAWQTPQQVYNVPLGQYGPVTTINNNGVRFIAWIQGNDNPGGYDIWALRQVPGQPSTDAVRVASFPNNYVSELNVFGDDNGNAFVTWTTNSPPLPVHIWVSRFTAGSGWGTPQIINGNSKLAGTQLHLAFDHVGNALALWKEDNCCNGLTYQVIVADRYTVATGWSKPIHLDDSTSLLWGKIDIQMDSAGNAYASWLRLDDNTHLYPKLMISRYSLNNGWSTPQIVATESVSHADGYQALAVNPRGEAILMWTDDYGVSIARSDNTGGWSGSMIIDSTNTNSPTQMVMLDDDEVFAAFGNGVMNFMPDNGHWSSLHPLQTDRSTTEGGDVWIVADISGNAMAAWVQVVDHVAKLYAKRYRSRWGWLGTERIDVNNCCGAEFFGLLQQTNGNVVLTWTQGNLSDASMDMKAAHFE